MKKQIITLAAVCISCLLPTANCQLAFSQSPQSFKYQSIVRNAAGNPMASTAITVRATVHDGSATGTIVYQETFAPTTNQFGLINLNIGTGTVVSGNFSTIAWGTGSKWMEIEADFGAGYLPMGTSQLLSVPYAMYANSSPVSAGPTGPTGATGTNGAPGPTGAQGIQGNAGPVGPTGAQGIQGNAGPVGPTGPAGANGTNGATGPTGVQGIQGNAGPIGPTGAQGIQGNAGPVGPTGPAGSANISGTLNNVIKFTGATTGGNSQITDDGNIVSIQGASATTSIFEAYRNNGLNYGAGRRTVLGYRNGTSGAINGGTAWTLAGLDAGVLGYTFWGNNYTAGVAGINYNDYTLCAGVFGADNFATYWGALGYKDAASTTWAGYFSGNMYCTGTLTQASDERLKENIQPYTGALEKINQLEIKTYNYKTTGEFRKRNHPTGKQFGFIAQDLQKVFPELVSSDFKTAIEPEKSKDAADQPKEPAYLGVNYIGMIPVLTQAIKEQQQQIDALKTEIEKLKSQNK